MPTAAIHLASPGDESQRQAGLRDGEPRIEAFAGTGKPYLHISGAWSTGQPRDHEESPFAAPALVAWREADRRRVLGRRRHARRGGRLRRRLRRTGGEASRGPAGLAPRRRRQPDHARRRDGSTGPTVHVADLAEVSSGSRSRDDSAAAATWSGDGLNPTVRRAHRGGRGRGRTRRARSRARTKRLGTRSGRLFRRGATLLDPGDDGGQGRRRARLAGPTVLGSRREFSEGQSTRRWNARRRPWTTLKRARDTAATPGEPARPAAGDDGGLAGGTPVLRRTEPRAGGTRRRATSPPVSVPAADRGRPLRGWARKSSGARRIR
jgi:hypothetical protein